MHIPGPDGPPALPYDHIIGPEGGEGGEGDGGKFNHSRNSNVKTISFFYFQQAALAPADHQVCKKAFKQLNLT